MFRSRDCAGFLCRDGSTLPVTDVGNVLTLHAGIPAHHHYGGLVHPFDYQKRTARAAATTTTTIGADWIRRRRD